VTSLPAKTCTGCGELKTLTDYHKNIHAKDGRQYVCKICQRIVDKKYRAEHREDRNAYQREHREKNKEALTAARHKYIEKNKEAIAAYHREYQKKNPHKYTEAMSRRKARKLNNGVLKYSTQEVLDTYGIDCHLCDRPVDMSAPRRTGYPGWETGLQIDHVIPISKGGQDSLANVRPSHGKCNITKSARLMGEF
jgi:5-methylcytosine-specific restriction endonuclease McrA